MSNFDILSDRSSWNVRCLKLLDIPAIFNWNVLEKEYANSNKIYSWTIGSWCMARVWKKTLWSFPPTTVRIYLRLLLPNNMILNTLEKIKYYFRLLML